MLAKPASCMGCPLQPISSGFMRPTLSVNGYGVALVGEALGDWEAKYGDPFQGPAGYKLTRLIEWAGLDRARFDIWNVAWCQPPENRLEGEPYEFQAIEHCKTAHWLHLVERARVIVPLGNVPLHAFTQRKGILATRGYAREGWGRILLPTVHPSFIQRGNSNYAPAVINDLQHAVSLARDTVESFRARQLATSVGYLLDPPAEAAERWARSLLGRLSTDGSEALLSYDIETPWKGKDEGELENEDQEDDIREGAGTILRIGFSAAGQTLSIPWDATYIPTIRLLLGSETPKVVWNSSFDTPAIRAHGVSINGPIHDGMVAWHVLHSDLPKGLGFVATFTCPDQPEWKHLSNSAPAFYNATDARVETDSMQAIRQALRKEGSLWKVYEDDVLSLEPILAHMSEKGMPIDAEVRSDRAQKLSSELGGVITAMEAAVPLAARRVAHVYKNKPKDTTGLLSRPADLVVPVCDLCGARRPRKDHFKTFKRKVNPCAGGVVVPRTERGEEYYRLDSFTPSRQQLMTYQGAMRRGVPTTWDSKTRSRKASMNEKAIIGLKAKFPLDALYPLVLTYRKLKKMAGTYIGYPAQRPNENQDDDHQTAVPNV